MSQTTVKFNQVKRSGEQEISQSQKNRSYIMRNGKKIGEGVEGLFGNPPLYDDYSIEGLVIRLTSDGRICVINCTVEEYVS